MMKNEEIGKKTAPATGKPLGQQEEGEFENLSSLEDQVEEPFDVDVEDIHALRERQDTYMQPYKEDPGTFEDAESDKIPPP